MKLQFRYLRRILKIEQQLPGDWLRAKVLHLNSVCTRFESVRVYVIQTFS